ncbi:hypothetical protein HY970_03465 [Candidatus Kaiserbacteria bacterium]|nr:hypothetical protein [Candidatus Kaiserbacteria bacterium]
MDDIKDVQRTDQVSRLMDNSSVRTNPFGENRSAERLYRRAERIVVALHLLTKHISENESVRMSLRAESAKLLPAVLDLRDEMRALHSQRIVEVQSQIRHISSLVRILAASGFISMQNTQVMLEALDELGSFLVAAQRSSFSESVSISRDDFLDTRTTHSSRDRSSRHIKDIENTSVKDSPMISDGSPVSLVGADINGHRGNQRTQNILDVLKSGGLLSIKDISSHLPEYSEKMIQRELFGLVSRGLIKKTGLKRWSKYAIA